MAQRILVVEDDVDTARVVRAYLERDGFEVEVARDGVTGLELALQHPPDLVVLDWMLPGLDGLSFLRTLRRGEALPVIMLTARTEEGDRIAGLEAGADDYVAKPFSPRELSARVRAVLRRAPAGEVGRDDVEHDAAIEVAGLRVDGARRRVEAHGRALDLSALEFDLLADPGRRPRACVHPQRADRARVGTRLHRRRPRGGRARVEPAAEARGGRRARCGGHGAGRGLPAGGVVRGRTS